MSVEQDLGDVLVALGLAVWIDDPSGAGDLMRGRLQDSPDNAVALMEYGGITPDAVHSVAQIATDRPSIQASIRGATYEDAQVRAYGIYRALGSLHNAVVGSVRYLSVTANQTPFLREYDGKERPVFVVNFDIRKDPS